MTDKETKYSYTFALTKNEKLVDVQTVKAVDLSNARTLLETNGFLEDNVDARCIDQPNFE